MWDSKKIGKNLFFIPQDKYIDIIHKKWLKLIRNYEIMLEFFWNMK